MAWRALLISCTGAPAHAVNKQHSRTANGFDESWREMI
jgi:hypothetical protein